MLTVYGVLMPLRLLEEIRFWKMQEKEHTVVIRELAPRLEPEYVKLLQEWEPVFEATENAAEQGIKALLQAPPGITAYSQAHADLLLRQSVLQSDAFVRQLNGILAESSVIKADPTAQVVIRHIIRESEYFLCVLQSFGTPGIPYASVPSGPSWYLQSQPLSSPFRQDNGQSLSQEIQTHIMDQKDTEKQQRHTVPSPAATGEDTWSTALAPKVKPVPVGGHTLPPLPYAYDALEPYIDKETMQIHHDKHHQSYVDGLNTAEKKLAEARASGDFTLVKHWERELAFNGAGHYLHTIFWNVMAPKAGGKATGLAEAQIQKDFGSFEAFKSQFSQAAEKVEGGGWAIWVWSPRSHRTEILTAEKHQNLSQWDVIPLLPLDVWEHAYYLKHQNKRPDYIKDWWSVVNWKHVNDRLTAARQLMWTPF
jgi:superoxide dismutase, Fe-Mn family